MQPKEKTTKSSWRKEKRPFILNASFCLLCIGFVGAYAGAVHGMELLAAMASLVMLGGGILAILVKNK